MLDKLLGETDNETFRARLAGCDTGLTGLAWPPAMTIPAVTYGRTGIIHTSSTGRSGAPRESGLQPDFKIAQLTCCDPSAGVVDFGKNLVSGRRPIGLPVSSGRMLE